MCSTVSLHTPFFSILLSLLTFYPSIENPDSNHSFPESSSHNFSRTRRGDSYMMDIHGSVCSELHKVQQSAFVVLVIIHESGRLQCMGSIIDEYHVLSVKDCYTDKDIASLMVVAGYASPYYGRDSQVKYVRKIARHQKDNLAILQLSKPFTFTKNVQPARIIGPGKAGDGTTKFKDAYGDYKPYIIAGFRFKSKLSPLRGDLIPKGKGYLFRDDQVLEDLEKDCADERWKKAGVEKSKENMPPIDKNRNYCTNGTVEFCWTSVGSPSVVSFKDEAYQIGIVTYAKCQFVEEPADSKDKKEEQVEFSPILHLRLDWFWKWIKANSFIEQPAVLP